MRMHLQHGLQTRAPFVGKTIGLGDSLDDRIHALDIAAHDPDSEMPSWVMRHLVNMVKETRCASISD